MNRYPENPTRPYDEEDQESLFDNLFSVASNTECTGLIPGTAVSDAELDSYSEIYDIPLSKNKNRNITKHFETKEKTETRYPKE